MSEPLAVRVSEVPRALTVSGELDMLSAETLERHLDAAITSPGPIILAFEDVSFMDSTGVRLLVRAATTANANGACLIVHGARPNVLRVFEISGVAEMLPGLHVVPHVRGDQADTA